MTDLDTRLRAGLHALVEDVHPLARPVAVPPRRRWPLVTAGLAGSLVLGGVAAAATGVLPDGVRDRFEEMAHWGSVDGLDADAARLVAADELDGVRYELWTAEGAHGGRCEYVREITAGKPENGSRICNASDVLVFQREDLWFSGIGQRRVDGSHATVQEYGRAPRGTAEVGIVRRDGTEERHPVDADGWFLDARRGELQPWRSYVAYDADGRVVARYDQT